MRNPFTPSFGKVPPIMAGRQRVLDDLFDAFANGPGDPNLTTIFIGPRGAGKTALLTRVSQEIQSCGWISVDVSARPGMLEDIILRTRKRAAHLIDPDSGAHLSGVQIGQLVGLAWESGETAANWRSAMEDLIDQLSVHDTGLLITVDEVRGDLDEMVDLVSVYQHFVREDKKVALLMAGLPFKVSELLANEDISFLRRARHRYFGRVSDFEIRDAFEKTVLQAGRTIDDSGLDRAVETIGGFPYLMQLVGYYAWNENAQSPEITGGDVEKGSRLAMDELAVGVFDTTFRELSAKDREFVFAMLEDEGDSAVASIAKRMEVKSNYAGQYKRRLLEQGVIGERSRGVVGFELPGFREYLIRQRDEQ